MYIRANVGGFYRRDATSPQWTPLMDFISAKEWNLPSVESVAIDPTNADRVYAAIGGFLDNAGALNGAILASSDRGHTFSRVDLPFRFGGNDVGHEAGERLAVDPQTPSQVYFGTHSHGLWHSSDFGKDWGQLDTFPVKTSTDDIGVTFVRFDPNRPGLVYVAVHTEGLFRSSDSGLSWEAIPNQPTKFSNGDAVHAFRSAIDPNGTLYVTFSNSVDQGAISNGAVFKLDPDQDTWTNITPPLFTYGTTNYGYGAIEVDRAHPGTVMAATWNRWWPSDTIFRSTNSGDSWASLADYSQRDGSLSPYVYDGTGVAYFGIWISSIVIDPFDSNHALYQGGNTVWETHDLLQMDALKANHWQIGADGIEETVVRSLISPPSGAHLLSGVGDQGGFRHDDFGVSPAPFENPRMMEVRYLDYAESNPDFIAHVGPVDYQQQVKGAYSTDGGSHWTPFGSVPDGAVSFVDGALAAMIAVTADAKSIIWAPATAVPSLSRDNGSTWTAAHGAPAGLRVVADRVNPNKLYGYDGASGAFYVSTDQGATFQTGALDLPSGRGNPGWTNEAQPRAARNREGHIWLPLSNGLYRSTDAGASFSRVVSVQSATLVSFGMPAVDGDYPSVFIVGALDTGYGFFRSDDEGATWVRVNDDAHQFGNIAEIAGDPREFGRLYVGTSGRGIICGDPGK